MKIMSRILVVVFAAVMLQSCGDSMKKQTGGTLLGGLAGGLVGSAFGKGSGRIVAAGLGAVAGAVVGNQIGKSLDEKDRLLMEKSSQQALEYSPSGKSVPWSNPDNGNSGSVRPVKTYRTSEGKYCREYTQDVMIGGESHKAFGKACREPDGHWRIAE